MQLDPFKLGMPRQVYFKPGGLSGRYWRPVSAIEVDSRGQVYVASAYDPEDDGGPFASIIWLVGQIRIDRARRVTFDLFRTPRQMARLDGLKVEGLAVRERERGLPELFAGVDDENYGGTLRQIPSQGIKKESHRAAAAAAIAQPPPSNAQMDSLNFKRAALWHKPTPGKIRRRPRVVRTAIRSFHAKEKLSQSAS